MRWPRGRHSAVAVVVALVLGAVEAGARDCDAPAEVLACSTNDECGCGVRAGTCAVAARECVAAGACTDYCGGRFGALAAVCRSGQCLRALPTVCAGDCDADAAVGIAELVVGIGIALDTHPLAACPTLDGDGDGAAGVDELVRAVRAALEGCAAAVAPFPGLRGYYDVVLTSAAPAGPVPEADETDEGSLQIAAVAAAYATDDGLSLHIDQGPNATIHLSGPLVNGRLTLSGYYLFTDIAVGLSGDATVVTQGGEDVISGTIMADSPYTGVPDTFVLHRTAAENPARFSGVLTLHFTESPSGSGMPSHAAIRLDIAPGGFALTSEGEDRGAADTLYGSLTTGTCYVAPGGHLACSMLYLLPESPRSTPLRLTGGLDASGGGGAFLSGTDPPLGLEPYVYGGWSADHD